MVKNDGIVQRNILAGFTLAERSNQSSNSQTAKHIEGLEVFYNATKPLKLFQPAGYHVDNSSYPYTSMSQNKESTPSKSGQIILRISSLLSKNSNRFRGR